MTRKLIQKIDTVQGWNIIGNLFGVASVGCLVVYLILR